MLLLVIFAIRYFYRLSVTRQAELRQQHLDAMISMFSSVRHMLNNDMQVVLGNAELAEIVADSGGDARKPVKNITLAANDAIERIEQLSAFNATGQVAWKAVDLSATLRESMAKLSADLPPIVNLRLELDTLSSRVIADRYLLCLSLSHLIRQAANSMRHGGEIVVRACEENGRGDRQSASLTVRIEILVVRALSLANAKSANHSLDAAGSCNDRDHLENGFDTTKALMERSGAGHVKFSTVADEALLSMTFSSETSNNKRHPLNVYTLGENFS